MAKRLKTVQPKAAPSNTITVATPKFYFGPQLFWKGGKHRPYHPNRAVAKRQALKDQQG